MDINGTGPPYPLSPMQQGMLFESTTLSRSGIYTIQVLCRMHGELNMDAFTRSWQRVMDRHDVLRTRFLRGNLEQPLQQVVRSADPPLETQDWSNFGPVDIDARLERFLITDRQRGFDLATAPLMRITLLRFGQREWGFLWSFHHAILDGWSRTIVLKESCLLYQAFCRHEDLALPQSRPYKEYIDWLGSQSFAKAEPYWREMLSGTAPLPIPSPAVQNGLASEERFSSRAIDVSGGLRRQLQLACETRGVTMNALIQAAWAIVLGHLTGSHDVIFGVTRSGRSTGPEGIESMVGLFINTLPICLRLNDAAPVSDLLQEVRRQNTAIMRFYEHVPVSEIKKLAWDDPRSALFESIVVVEHDDLISSLREICPAAEFIRYGFSGEGLGLFAHLNPELSLQMSFDRYRFSSDAIQQLATRYVRVLAEIANSPHRPIRDLVLFTEKERQQIVSEWKMAAPEFEAEKCLHELFEQQAQLTPTDVALEYGEERLTYRELNLRANQVAHYLRRLGVLPESRVGLCMEVGSDLAVCLIGILKAGAAYIPLDPVYPIERLRYMAEDAQIRVVLSDGSFSQEHLAGWHGTIINVSNERTVIAAESDENPATLAISENLAYVIYTSGSTGRPKGVAVTHQNVARLFAATLSVFNFNSGDVWTMFHSFAFDFSVWELWGALLYGGKVVLVSAWQSRSPEVFYKMLQAHGVTVLNQTPSAFRQLLEVDEKQRAQLDVRVVIFGGEALNPDALAGWRQRHPKTRLVNMYGITEITVHGTYIDLTEKDLRGRESVIGTEIPDLQMYVMNTQMEPEPTGVTGELYVGGAGLARGYLNRPELTAERFVPDPYGGRPGARLYKTGDRARWQAERRLEFLGRIDDQVKIRGYRIELGEIEAIIVQHSAVKEAVVSVQDFGGDKRLIAHFVARDGTTVTEDNVVQHLKERLPDYMVPARVIKLNSLPLTRNGKVDRAALPAPDRIKETFVPAQTKLEALLAKMWADLLQVDCVGRRDNFFSLGGHSLLAMQVASRLREILQIDLPTRLLFGHPTIETLTQALTALEPASGQFERIATIFLTVEQSSIGITMT